MNYIPKYIYQAMEYMKSEIVTSEDYNAILNLLIQATDNNTEALFKLFTDPNIKWVLNTIHADVADKATLAEDCNKFAGRGIQPYADGPLADDDMRIPTSKLVKRTIESYNEAYLEQFTKQHQAIQKIVELNTEQNNRLSTIDGTLTSHNTRIAGLERWQGETNNTISNIKKVDIHQDEKLASHAQRLTNLEIGNIPEDVTKTLMLKANYALPTGELDPEGAPIYSLNTVSRAYAAANLLIGDAMVPGTDFARAEALNALNAVSFIIRGNLPAAKQNNYTVGELRTLRIGAYEVSSAQALKLIGLEQAGTLRIYPCTNGLSLRYEKQVGSGVGTLVTLFVPASTPGSKELTSFTWYNESATNNSLQSQINSLSSSKLNASGLTAGADISITGSGTSRSIKYTGPRIVIQSSQPSADPNRKTLWIKL